jgi:hypothetical protein
MSIFWKEIARRFETTKRRNHDNDKHVKRKIMNTQRTLIIYQNDDSETIKKKKNTFSKT